MNKTKIITEMSHKYQLAHALRTYPIRTLLNPVWGIRTDNHAIDDQLLHYLTDNDIATGRDYSAQIEQILKWPYGSTGIDGDTIEDILYRAADLRHQVSQQGSVHGVNTSSAVFKFADNLISGYEQEMLSPRLAGVISMAWGIPMIIVLFGVMLLII
ncbi:MAG: hypothetical protein LKF52_11810 [Butyrivibrio sp.]|nr:hypothetical protein [Butyrivibrio sp.]